MSYCDANLVRAISGLDGTEIKDHRITDLRDNVATARLNDDIQTRVEKEAITQISSAKPNTRDGENTTFYLKKLHNNFRSLGDLNDDGVIDSEDIDAWAVEEDERKNVEVVNIIDPDEGEFEARIDGSPPTKNASMYARYRHAPVNVAEPNQTVSIACAQLTGAFCFSNIETAKLKDFSIGDVNINKQSQGFSIMMDQYKETMRRIVNRELIEFDENQNEVEDVIKDDMAGDNPLGQGKDTLGGRFRSG